MDVTHPGCTLEIKTDFSSNSNLFFIGFIDTIRKCIVKQSWRMQGSSNYSSHWLLLKNLKRDVNIMLVERGQELDIVIDPIKVIKTEYVLIFKFTNRNSVNRTFRLLHEIRKLIIRIDCNGISSRLRSLSTHAQVLFIESTFQRQ